MTTNTSSTKCFNVNCHSPSTSLHCGCLSIAPLTQKFFTGVESSTFQAIHQDDILPTYPYTHTGVPLSKGSRGNNVMQKFLREAVWDADSLHKEPKKQDHYHYDIININLLTLSGLCFSAVFYTFNK